MANELAVVSDTKTATSEQLVVRNYDQHPKPCRRGYWMALGPAGQRPGTRNGHSTGGPDPFTDTEFIAQVAAQGYSGRPFRTVETGRLLDSR